MARTFHTNCLGLQILVLSLTCCAILGGVPQFSLLYNGLIRGSVSPGSHV